VALLAGVIYDPSTAATSASGATLIAMTAIDTTNLRVTFTAPANGIVLVRLRGLIHGAGTSPQLLLGVLDGATVRGRVAPYGSRPGATNTLGAPFDCSFLVTGLTPSTSYTWDAAYGVEFVVASSAIKYGGPNDTTANNAFGSFSFEVWETANLLSGKLYDPSTAVTNKSIGANLALTALDTTNLRLTFTAPASGKVWARLQGTAHGGSTSWPGVILGVLDGSTVRARGRALLGTVDAGLSATLHMVQKADFLITGLTPTTSYSFDAAYGVEVILSSSNIKYGGPDDTTGDNAWGGFVYEIWTA
jgi:hypothetical protein